jgi:hypothetical protein
VSAAVMHARLAMGWSWQPAHRQFVVQQQPAPSRHPQPSAPLLSPTPLPLPQGPRRPDPPGAGAAQGSAVSEEQGADQGVHPVPAGPTAAAVAGVRRSVCVCGWKVMRLQEMGHQVLLPLVHQLSTV